MYEFFSELHAPALLTAPLSVVALFLIAKALWRSRAGTTPYCAECGYNLTGSHSERCPECGVRIGRWTVERGEPAIDLRKLAAGFLILLIVAALWILITAG